MWEVFKQIIGPVVTCVLGVLMGMIANVRKKQREHEAIQKRRNELQEKRLDALEDGVKGLLHDRIHERYHECDKKGYADVQDRENMEKLYEPYHALGGNGTGTDLYTKMRALPTAPADNKTPENPA